LPITPTDARLPLSTHFLCEFATQVRLLDLEPFHPGLGVDKSTVSRPSFVARDHKRRWMLDELEDRNSASHVKDSIWGLDGGGIDPEEQTSVHEFLSGGRHAAHGEASQLAQGVAPSPNVVAAV
jgi:hypothetical protein